MAGVERAYKQGIERRQTPCSLINSFEETKDRQTEQWRKYRGFASQVNLPLKTHTYFYSMIVAQGNHIS
jgi:hypothetical protein